MNGKDIANAPETKLLIRRIEALQRENEALEASCRNQERANVDLRELITETTIKIAELEALLLDATSDRCFHNDDDQACKLEYGFTKRIHELEAHAANLDCKINCLQEDLKRVTDHLHEWSKYHSDEMTCDIEASIFCARSTLALTGYNHGE